MNSIAMKLPAARKRERNLPSIWQPIDEWSRRRTALAALAVASLVTVFGVRAWRMSDASQVDASRVEWAATQAKARDAGRIAAELPELRARVALRRLEPEHWSAADALRGIADIAAQSGLRETAIEPVPAKIAKGVEPKTPAPTPERTLKLRAQGSFAEMRRFLEALAGMPRLVVPEGVQIRRQPDALVIETALRVFDSLPPIPLATASPRANAFIVDPFGSGESAPGGDMLLVGTFIAPRRVMALLQSAVDVDGFAPGQKVGQERLARVVPRTVELVRDDGSSRKLTMTEDRP
ncbi:type 4a pilus biogenesis protein PilO [Caballeronia insecticola]|uniref:Uncharacterized protein n=1 Tax=Caballeronia insecticola TaxID=758793 RepID=R4WJ02_9BURK|nr:type 4a pilus biogenesis protein PilO [Caballeronia insecticola]BAN24294.1 putative uncharacterized protein [Caballeronia insecticola]